MLLLLLLSSLVLFVAVLHVLFRVGVVVVVAVVDVAACLVTDSPSRGPCVRTHLQQRSDFTCHSTHRTSLLFLEFWFQICLIRPLLENALLAGRRRAISI